MAESCVMLHVERLPEGGYLATSEAIQGLVAQGRTVSETLEIARDVARRLLEAQQERQQDSRLPSISESFDYPLIVSA
jgi:predicted RNase H-like HicB family nuclease